jgi:excinuclease ABC subunit C
MPNLSRWKKLIEDIPERCGVYIFKNRNGYIYIGKAKNLKRRLLDHLRASKEDPKEFQIFAQSEDLEYILTQNEFEALVLERELINLHKPKFNVVFKHGSGFPMLVITDEDFPTVKIVRNFEERGQYFGPFFTVNQAKRVKKLIHQIFKLRTCEVMPNKVCMDYHLGLCSGPCEGKISQKDYRLAVESAKAFLSGEVGNILPTLYEKIEKYAQRLEFEKCALLKEQVVALENLAKGQNVLNLPFLEADLWVPNGKEVTLYLIRAKKFVGKHSFEIPPAYDEGLESWLLAYYSVNYIPQRVFFMGEIENLELLGRFLQKKRGQKVEIERGIPSPLEKLVEINTPLRGEAEELFRELLGLSYPRRIEGFDISHFGGEAVVGSCVVWEEGKMNKKCYRKYRIKTFEGIDDYRALREVLTRRAKRIKKGQYPEPDIWLIDGGKGQLGVALEVKRKFGLNTFVCSLAKREEILYTEDGKELRLKEYPALYRIFGLIRDEAHRFAVGYNRKLRKLKILGKLPQRERKILERNFDNLYEVLETEEETLKRLGLDPSLKQELKRNYLNRER